VLFASVTTTVALLFRYGYSFGLFDQTVYSLRGIALADPSAFRSDWFARTVPQPHWLFDAITFVGSRLGILPWVYLGYWLAGIAVFALASVWLTQRFLPERPALAAVLGPLVVLGPEKILGSTTPLLWFADPHMLGGCLAFLALVALLTDRWRVAVVAALLAGAFHIQHGANLAPVLLLTAVLARGAAPRRRIMLAATAVGLVVGAQAIALWRGIHTSGDEWLTICRDLIPFHCYAPNWSWTYLASGAAILALAFGFGWWRRHAWRTVVPVAVLPAAGLLAGVIAERFQLGLLGRLAALDHVHRLATMVEPFAAFALVCLLGGAVSGNRRRRLISTALAVPGLLMWLAMSGGALRHPSAASLVVVAGVAGLVMTTLGLRVASIPPLRPALVAAVTVVVAAAAFEGSLGRIGYDRVLPVVRVGHSIGRAVPPAAVIAAPPEIVWLRSLSRRSVVADCKAVPFGGRPWDEYVARMEALGGHCAAGGPGFDGLQPDDIQMLQAKYGATHLLLYLDDAKLPYARDHWRQVLAVPAEADQSLQRGLILFELNPDDAASASPAS
jgi:hypothetical protein